MLYLFKKKGVASALYKTLNNNLFTPNIKRFSGNHHSDTDSDHDHHHHSSSQTSGLSSSDNEGAFPTLKSRVQKPINTFSVDQMLDKVKTPITKTEKSVENAVLYQNEGEYINFLASSFEKKALEKYPEYKSNLEELKPLILNYDRLNPYQKEVQTLDKYLTIKLDKERIALTEKVLGSSEGTPLEQSQRRLNTIKRIYSVKYRLT